MSARVYDFRPRRGPVPEFEAGEAEHLLLDAGPDFGVWEDEHGERHEPGSAEAQRLRARSEARNRSQNAERVPLIRRPVTGCSLTTPDAVAKRGGHFDGTS